MYISSICIYKYISIHIHIQLPHTIATLLHECKHTSRWALYMPEKALYSLKTALHFLKRAFHQLRSFSTLLQVCKHLHT